MGCTLHNNLIIVYSIHTWYLLLCLHTVHMAMANTKVTATVATKKGLGEGCILLRRITMSLVRNLVQKGNNAQTSADIT